MQQMYAVSGYYLDVWLSVDRENLSVYNQLSLPTVRGRYIQYLGLRWVYLSLVAGNTVT